MNFDEHEIKHMVGECLGLILEATTEAVYAKYYSNIIPQEMWDTLVDGTANITPFHRKVADVIANTLKKSNEYRQSGHESDAVYFAQMASATAGLAKEAWNSGNYTSQFLVATAKEGYPVYDKMEYLMYFLKRAKGLTKYSREDSLSNGVYTAYEDDNLLVTVTLNYTVSHKLYHDSHWCTASGIDGRYNGFDMFKNYTDEGQLLAQFVDKKDRTQSYQVCIDSNRDTRSWSVCDYFDKEYNWDHVVSHFGQAAVTALENISRNYETLSKTMLRNLKSEEAYYKFENFKYIKRYLPSISNKLSSEEGLQRMLSEFFEAIRYINIYGGNSDSFEFSREAVFPDNIGIYNVWPRTNYIVDTDDEGTDIYDYDAMERSIFTEEERSAISRVNASAFFDDNDYTSRVLFIKQHTNEDNSVFIKEGEIIKCVPGCAVGNIGKIVIINHKNSSDYYRYDGELILTTKEGDGISRLDIVLRPMLGKRCLFFGKLYNFGGGSEGEVNFAIDTKSGELININRKITKRDSYYDFCGEESNSLTEQDIKGMVGDCLNLLLEATTQDVYAKYYADKIPENIWNVLVQGTENITPFHRKVADAIINEIKRREEIRKTYPHVVGEMEKLESSLMKLATIASAAWNSGDYARQFLLHTAKENFHPYESSADSLSMFLKNATGIKKFSSDEVTSNGLVKVYEDKNLLVTITLSYSASRSNYHDSHWCTASGIDGRWNGFTMFCNYAGDNCLLVQFVDKRDRSKSYQVAVSDEYETSKWDVYDFQDTKADLIDVMSSFGKNVVTSVINNILYNFDEYYKKSRELVREEKMYYEFENHKFVRRVVPRIDKKLSSIECQQRLIDELNRREVRSFSLGTSRMVEDGPDKQYILYNVTVISPEELGSEEETQKSFFTKEEMSLNARLDDMTCFTEWDKVSRVAGVLFHRSERRFELIFYKKGWSYIGMNNMQVITADGQIEEFVDIRNGRTIFALNRGGKLVRVQGSSGNTVFFGEVTDDDRKWHVLFELDTVSCEMKKVDYMLKSVYGAFQKVEDESHSLSEEEIKGMVSECLGLLLETSMDTVYERYYKDTIPLPTWEILKSSTKDITPFHKKVADLISKTIRNLNLIAVTPRHRNYLMKSINNTASWAADAWSKGEKARQFLNSTAKENFFVYDSIDDFLEYIQKFLKSTRYSENEFIEPALYKAYEDDNLLVTVTLSYSASRRYYGDSHWCTASGIDGRYNGFDLFKNYTRWGGFLVQFVDKKDRTQSYQVSASNNWETCCDFFDRVRTIDDISEHFGAKPVEEAFKVLTDHYKELENKTQAFLDDEEAYYQFSLHKYISHNAPALANKFNSQECVERMMKELNQEAEFCWGEATTTSFQFSIDNDIECEDEEGYPYNIVQCYMRTDYDLDDEYDDEDAAPPIDYETMNASFFTEEEINLGERCESSPSFNLDFLKRVIICKETADNRFELINTFPGGLSDSIGKIAKIRLNDVTTIVNFTTGKPLLVLKRNGIEQLKSFWAGDAENKIIYYGRKTSGNEAKAMFKINTAVGELVKINKVIDLTSTHDYEDDEDETVAQNA